MAGSISATTIGLIAAGVGAAGVGAGVYSGMKQSDAQNAALKKQNTAEQTATSAALSTQRQGEIAQGDANKKAPDIAGILQRAAATGNGLGTTMLTGPTGVNNGGLNLGGSTLLGS